MNPNNRRCVLHPEKAAEAFCAECLQPICADDLRQNDDGLTVCPYAAERRPCPAQVIREAVAQSGVRVEVGAAERVASAPRRAANPAGPEREPAVPWEDRQQHPNPFNAFLATGWSAITAPFQFMERVPWVRGNLKQPLLFAFFAYMIGKICIALMLSRVITPETPQGARVLELAATLGVSLNELLMIQVALMPLALLIRIYGGGWLVHKCLSLYRGQAPARPREATYRVLCYAEASSLLNVVPALGMLVASFLWVVLLISGLRLAHKLPFAQAIFGLLSLLLAETLLLQTWLF